MKEPLCNPCSQKKSQESPKKQWQEKMLKMAEMAMKAASMQKDEFEEMIENVMAELISCRRMVQVYDCDNAIQKSHTMYRQRYLSGLMADLLELMDCLERKECR